MAADRDFRSPGVHVRHRFLRATLVLSLVNLSAAGFVMAAEANPLRVALVIGNSTYPSMPLANPVNDAKAMGTTLRQLGFTVVEVINGTKSQMDSAIQEVGSVLQGKAGIGMLYYAGHGIQVDAQNYMIPVNARLSTPGDVQSQTLNLTAVVSRFRQAGTRMNIIVLDACRNNPFGPIATGKGLAPLDAPTGTFFAFATAPGNVAADGDKESGNGLYTQYLLRELRNPQSRIEDVFKRVRLSVRKASGGQQIPWESTSLEEDFEFQNGRVLALAPNVSEIEAAFAAQKSEWDQIRNSNSLDQIYGFLNRYPNGPLSEAAQSRLNELSKPTLLVQGAAPDGGDQVYSISKFRLGDVFESRVTFELNGKELNVDSREQVVRVENSRVEVKMTNKDNPIAGSAIIYNQDGSLISFDTVKFDPPQQWVPGGLIQVGRTWSSAYNATFDASMGVAPKTFAVSGRVVGRERITVPAGVFDTFKLEITTREVSGANMGAVNNMIAWVSPDLPKAVKFKMPNGGYEELVKVVRGK